MQAFAVNDWIAWRQQGYSLLPVAAVCANEPFPASFAGFSDARATVLLESGRSGRYSYLCDRPRRCFVGWEDRMEVWSADFLARDGVWPGKPLDLLARALAERRVPTPAGWPPMTGGLLGAFGYDLVHTWERLPRKACRDLGLPLFAAIEPRELFIYDHQERTLGVVVWTEVEDQLALRSVFTAAEAQAQAAIERWRRAARAEVRPETRAVVDDDAEAPGPSFPPGGFERAVERVLGYIAAGDTYQVNLSVRESRATNLGAAQIYEAVRAVNPSPYMGLFRFPDWALVCGSPELLVKLANGVLSSRPIAGTRPRGAAPSDDTALSAELFASAKERAEHLMLVDLIRNDIGRVADFGSVHVAEFMALERYSHVMHIVSQVEGRLAPGRSWGDVFRAMFPGGTITGCPKIRTMEIIEELEPVGRGFYTGALGWISYGGDLELNIVIRSMLVKDGCAHVQAGAGIVADSQPARELDEARRKAQALWVALDRATARATAKPAQP